MEGRSRPEFTENDLPLNMEQLRERETWMMEVGNWRGDHSVPSVGEHYRYMWKWDSYKGIVINARRGDPDRSRTEFMALEKYRDKQTGFLSNKIFATADHKTWRDYPEAWNFNDNTVGTSYSQPPIAAWAAIETYDCYAQMGRDDEGVLFLKKAYGTAEAGNYTGLRGEYEYFINHRQNDFDDPLVGIVHPNETGRDSDEACKPWLLEKKQCNPVTEWLHMQRLGWQIGRLGRDPQGRRIDWIPEQVRPKYWVNDVMFNVMHANNLRNLSDVARILAKNTDSAEHQDRYYTDALKYRRTARAVEREVLDRMWNSREEYFYNLDMHGNQIPVESVTGLFPLMLEDISHQQISSLVDKLEDKTWFDTPYPIPTHATRSRFYDPDPEGLNNKLTPKWSGTVWLDVNHFIVEDGLVPRALDLIEGYPVRDTALSKRMMGRAAIIAGKTRELLAGEPKAMEYYSPTNGHGMRVADFMWSNIGLHFEKFEQAHSDLHKD